MLGYLVHYHGKWVLLFPLKKYGHIYFSSILMGLHELSLVILSIMVTKHSLENMSFLLIHLYLYPHRTQLY